MMFHLRIDCSNDAFDHGIESGDPDGGEIARILREVAEDVSRGSVGRNERRDNLRDLNGNRVGSWRMSSR